MARTWWGSRTARIEDLTTDRRREPGNGSQAGYFYLGCHGQHVACKNCITSAGGARKSVAVVSKIPGSYTRWPLISTVEWSVPCYRYYATKMGHESRGSGLAPFV